MKTTHSRPTRRRRAAGAGAVAALGAFAALAFAACDSDVNVTCPESKKHAAPCDSSLEIDLQRNGKTELKIGTYHLSIKYDGEDVGVGCALTGDQTLTCDAFNPAPAGEGWNPPIVKIEGGIAVTWQIVIPDAPKSVDVKLQYEDAVVAEETVTPEYDEHRANPHCPVLCETAVESLEVTYLTN